ncbi:MAG: DUF6691 family protein [Bacteroidota bacterium]|nr:DUF6691 family protein [Bacteroidota bacterium]
MKNIRYALVGALFGIVFVKAEIISWFRIQEMFRLQSFHMYGVIGSAVFVALIGIQIIKRFKIKTIDGGPIHLEGKPFNKGIILGSLCFGIGWALTGACPGPLYAQLVSGNTVIIVGVLSALLGTWTYGFFKEKLPH